MKNPPNPSQKFLNGIVSLVINQSTKAMLVFALLFMFTASYAQVFYGTTSGGQYGRGTIFKVNGDGSGYQKVNLRSSTASNNRYTRSSFDRYRMTPFSNGKLYGVTVAGGYSGDGVLFEFDPITNEYNEKKDFDFYNTTVPLGQMVEYDGKLFGTSVGMGYCIYSYTPSTNSFEIEFGLPSQSPGLILHDGKFYGMTIAGGTKRMGAIFEYNPSTKEYNVLFQFDRTSSGYSPRGGLTYVNGKLYGVTSTGGKYDQGTLFEYDLSAHHFEKKIDFKSNVNGSSPIGDLTLYKGKLLGITSSGGVNNQGVLFEFDLTTNLLNKVLDFSSASPAGTFKLIDGKLYGTSTDSGAEGNGILFSFDLSSKEYVRLAEFNGGETGSHPFGELALYGNTLWGMTKTGGKAGQGVLFKYNMVNHQLDVESSFGYSPLGKKPVCLIEVGTKYYGLLSAGGATDNGVLFEIDTTTFEFSKLHDFSCSQCAGYKYLAAEGQLIAVDNKLYGIFTKGGSPNGGELFEYDIDQKSHSTLVEFNTDETGLAPVGNMAILNGKIYGSTMQGGSENSGVLFEYDIEHAAFQIKKSLVYATTGSSLRFTNANNSLYGLGYGGSFRNGMLTKYDPVSNTLIPQYEFQNQNDGFYPIGSLSLESSKLYGVTQYSGTGVGTLFEFDIQTQLYKKIPNFQVNGYPNDAMVVHGNKIYGSGFIGTLIEFDLNKAEYQSLLSIPLEVEFEDNINSLIVHNNDFHTLPATTTEVIEFLQGKRKDGKAIDILRSDPQNALVYSNYNDSPYNGIQFVSLGFGGSISLAFDNQLYNKPGFDLYVLETSYGNPSFSDYPEQAEIFVSQNGENWNSLGYTNARDPLQECSLKLDSEFDIQHSGLDWIKFVKVVDVTNPLAKRRDPNTCLESDFFVFNSASDGFDLDAILQVKVTYPNHAGARSASSKGSEVINISATDATALLYPNPASSTLSINLSEEQELVIMEDDFHLEIIDTQGKTWTNSRELMDETWTINHDVSKLNPGMYIARVTNGNVRRHYKFMKN